MRWLTFSIVACIAVCVQTTLAQSLQLFGVGPQFVLIIMVHYALHARTSDGLIACWLLGLLVDLTSVERLGVVALAYGLTGMIVWSIRDLMFIRHPFTHFIVTFLSCFAIDCILRIFFRIYYDVPGSLIYLGLESLCSAAYTGLWAVIIHSLLMRLEKPLGLFLSKRSRLSRRSAG